MKAMILFGHPKCSGTLLKLSGMNLGPIGKMVLLFLFLTTYLSSGHVAEVEIVYGIGIKLCKLRCTERGGCLRIAYNIDELACHLSPKTARDWTEKEGYIPYPNQGNQLTSGACSIMTCKVNNRCLERRHGGAVCIEDKTVSSTLESRCVKDSDCPADRNMVCFTQTCRCEEGYTFNPTNNNCVRNIANRSQGESCRINSYCQTDKKFVCYEGICKCELGYHFNPSKENCLRRCNAYGNGFTSYDGLGIRGYDNKEIHVTTDEECADLCTGEKEYTCITFERDYVSNVCKLSQYGYLDVPSSERTKSHKGWVFEVRNCA